MVILHHAVTGLALNDPFGDLRGVVAEILALVIQICALLLALAIATGFLEAQVGFMAGRPGLLGEVWVKVGAVVICLAIALTAVPITNVLVGLLF